MLSVCSRVRATRAVVVGTLFVALAVPTAFAPAPAAASPADELAQQREIAGRLEQEIADNGLRISMLDEDYVEGRIAIERTTADIVDAEQRLDTAASESEALRAQLASRAAALYVQASDASPIDALKAQTVTEIGTRSKYGAAAAERDSTLIDDLSLVSQELEDLQRQLEQQRAESQATQDALAHTRDELATAQTDQEELLSQVKGDIAELVAQIEQQRREEEEARVRAEVEQRQKLEDAKRAEDARVRAETEAQARAQRDRDSDRATERSAGAIDAPAPGEDTSERVPAPNPNAQAAVDAARGELGKPYRYAGDGPETFDCSGLTMFVWAAAGVSLPHSSRAQYASLPHVSIDELEPGDLVFYGSPIHHVGIFIGNGQYIHAPQSGDIVKISSIYRDDYAGGARPG